MPDLWDRMIVALDLVSEKKIKQVIDSLSPKVNKFKVGLIAYTKFGPKVIKWVKREGGQVFLDFKLFDIPNTMIETAKIFVDLEVWGFTVHIKAGEDSLKVLKAEIRKEAASQKRKVPLIIGVTELTSKTASLTKVVNLARVASKADLDGVVCSVWEADKIKKELGLVTITPGIRRDRGQDDQKRIATVKDVLNNRVDYFVVGRPIIREKDCLKAAKVIIEGDVD